MRLGAASRAMRMRPLKASVEGQLGPWQGSGPAESVPAGRRPTSYWPAEARAKPFRIDPADRKASVPTLAHPPPRGLCGRFGQREEGPILCRAVLSLLPSLPARLRVVSDARSRPKPLGW
jgi:hypothetical protein